MDALVLFPSDGFLIFPSSSLERDGMPVSNRFSK